MMLRMVALVLDEIHLLISESAPSNILLANHCITFDDKAD